MVPTSRSTTPAASMTWGSRNSPHLDQLPSGDQDLPAPGEPAKGEQQRPGGVVHGQRGLGPGGLAQQRLGGGPAPAPGPGRQVVLHGGVAGGLGHRLPGRRRQRRPPQVRVQHHPGGVHHRPRAPGPPTVQLPGHGGRQLVHPRHRPPAGHRPPADLQRPPSRPQHRRPPEPARALDQVRMPEQHVHVRQQPPRVDGHAPIVDDPGSRRSLRPDLEGTYHAGLRTEPRRTGGCRPATCRDGGAAA